MRDASRSPADAIKAFYRVLEIEGVLIVPSYVAQDLAALRRAFPMDQDFSTSILSVAKDIKAAFRAPDSHGSRTSFALGGWRRSKFGGDANLRLIFRPAKPKGIEILAFGERNYPQSVYFTSTKRAR